MEITIQEALQKGIQAHKSGEYVEADKYYTAIIKANPFHADANHNMGVLAVDVGKASEALPFLEVALDANPRIAQFWISYIDALIRADQLDKARLQLSVAQKNGVGAESLHTLALRLTTQDAMEPQQDTINHILGKYRKGDLEDALAAALLELDLYPNSATLHNICGAINMGLGSLDRAIGNYTKALEINPGFADAHVNLGNAQQQQGHSKLAIQCYQKALEIKPDLAEAHNNLGNALSACGELEKSIQSFDKAIELKHGYIGAYVNKGNSLLKIANTDEAINCYGEALKLNPNYALAYGSMGNALKAKGDLDEAVEAYKTAIELNPNYYEAYNNMGNVFRDLDDFDEALDCYKKALGINPSYAIAYSNLGGVYHQIGCLDDAIKCHEQALTLDPSLPEAHASMGRFLRDKGELEAAIKCYQNAIAIKPDYALAHSNMGNVLRDRGDIIAAIESYQKAIKYNPDYADAFHNLGLALTDKKFVNPIPQLDETICLLLDRRSSVRPRNLASAIVSLIKLDPGVKQALNASSNGTIEQSLLQFVADLVDVPLLLKLMSVTAIPDLELESLLVTLRSLFLSELDTISESQDALLFQSKLALQCFTNEYIYEVSAAENTALAILKDKVRETLASGLQPEPAAVLCLASYEALHKNDWCPLLKLTPELQEVATRQILEPLEEERLKADIPFFSSIRDSISAEVRAQYEEHPYPRWVNTWMAVSSRPMTEIVQEANLKLIDSSIMKEEQPDILIAGCGTGQHPLAVASQYRHSKVLAVDLSLSSLAYAKRKTVELNVRNIDYMQADILDLAKLEKQFHLIESGGVLHHMKDPMAGWKELSDCLIPGGLMRIGLYSELARQDVVRIRQEIVNLGIAADDVAMKGFRSDILNSGQAHHARIQSFEDFYSLSELRDLLFHVQEHRFTLPQIENCLAELGLVFCGFDHPEIIEAFGRAFDGKKDAYDLKNWTVFEEDNPNAFAGMYQFWCQKPA